MISESYRQQVQLLIQTLPHVAAEECFALKGGTAINLFIRDLPRLSVDIDLTYLPVKERGEALADIEQALRRIAERVEKPNLGARVQMNPSPRDGTVTKMQVQRGRTRIKVEVTPVLRGCVFEPEERDVSPAVEDDFGFAQIKVVSFADLYAGKIVAALDRQHPRDLFDVRDLLANEGVDEALRQAFLIYLLSGNRPFAEYLDPSRKDITAEFKRGFVGMTREPVAQSELEAVREALIETMVSEMPNDHRAFLISAKQCEPKWELVGTETVKNLPAVRWRMSNLQDMDSGKRKDQLIDLRRVLCKDRT